MRKPELQDAAVFKKMAAVSPYPSCERSFANIFCYRDAADVQIEFAGDHLLIFQKGDGLWQFPLGTYLPPEELRRLCPEHSIYDVPEDYCGGEIFQESFDPGEADYLYLNRNIADFTGEKLRKKHNLCRQFQTQFPHWYTEKITPENLRIAFDFAFAANAAKGNGGFLDIENQAMAMCMENFFAPELELSGIILYAEKDTPAGFAVISPVPAIAGGMCDVHFEKADHAFKGAPQILTAELAAFAAHDFLWMNREQDMNVPGIRQAKTSLDPEKLFKRKTLTPLSATL